jgi:YhcH/YjgK/YiaL family protein
MILDSLSQWERYAQGMPSLRQGFEFIAAQAGATLAEGRHEIDGERAFAIVARYETRDYESAEPEAHRRYLDIQYLIAGRETIYWTPLAEAGPVTVPYDGERDLMFFARNDQARPIELSAGHFTIFFPEDAHEPNCHAGPPGPVHKVVVKIRL